MENGKFTPLIKCDEIELVDEQHEQQGIPKSFQIGEFLAVRNADKGFYLCQSLADISKNSKKKNPIRWLTQVDNKHDEYKMDYKDYIKHASILTNVDLQKTKRTTYKLPYNERNKMLTLLEQSIEYSKHMKAREQEASTIILEPPKVAEIPDIHESPVTASEFIELQWTNAGISSQRNLNVISELESNPSNLDLAQTSKGRSPYLLRKRKHALARYLTAEA
uniref:Ig-like domain-containing protein n=1 Tax=Trichogramma kaykai TaxID=54128 RepID=A0ABD2WYD6_9HYME